MMYVKNGQLPWIQIKGTDSDEESFTEVVSLVQGSKEALKKAFK